MRNQIRNAMRAALARGLDPYNSHSAFARAFRVRPGRVRNEPELSSAVNGMDRYYRAQRDHERALRTVRSEYSANKALQEAYIPAGGRIDPSRAVLMPASIG